MAEQVAATDIGKPDDEKAVGLPHVDSQKPLQLSVEPSANTSTSNADRPVRRRWPFSLSQSKKPEKPVDNQQKDKEKSEEDQKDDGDGDSKKKAKDAPPPVSTFQLYRFHTKLENTLNIIGIFLAIASGAAQPLMTLMFGNLTTAFVDFGTAASLALGPNPTPEQLAALNQAGRQFRQTAAKDALYLVFIGLAMFLCTYGYMVIWTRTSETAAKRIRENYLRAILRQDIAFFDDIGPGEVATRIQTDTHLVHLGISEKVPMACSFLGAFFTGFILAYIRSWKLALACSSILPCIAITGALLNTFSSKLKTKSLNHMADSGSLAEEVISTIRTAQAFGTQTTLAKMYSVHIDKTHTTDRKLAIVEGLGIAVFFFVIYATYGLAFSFGTTLLLRGEVDIGMIVN
ncbi:GTPase-activating protein, partial [Serendipita sp. 399]